MTKQNPDKLCPSCQQFDYIMNRKDGSSCDIFVVCECEEKNLNDRAKNFIKEYDPNNQ